PDTDSGSTMPFGEGLTRSSLFAHYYPRGILQLQSPARQSPNNKNAAQEVDQMTTITRILVGLLIAAGLALPAHAETPNREALAKELMRLSGMERQLSQIPQQVLAGLDKDGKKLPQQRYRALRRV